MARSEKSTTTQRAPKAEMQRHIDNFRAVGDAHANRHGIEAFRTEHPNVLSLLWRPASCPLRFHEFHHVSVVLLSDPSHCQSLHIFLLSRSSRKPNMVMGNKDYPSKRHPQDERIYLHRMAQGCVPSKFGPSSAPPLFTKK